MAFHGTADCGMFALAVAISLCNGDDPSTQAYDQRVMRAHLALCFECGEFAAFPVKKLSSNVTAKVEVTEELFCHCRMPYRKGQFMIAQDVKDGFIDLVIAYQELLPVKHCFTAKIVNRDYYN